MNTTEKQFKMGMVAALLAVKQTLEMYPEGMDAAQVNHMLEEIDQQMGVKGVEIELLKRA